MTHKTNHQNSIDFYAFLNLMPPGTMVCDLFEFAKSKPEAAFLIKENPARLGNLGQKVHIEMRSAVLKADHVFLIPWMLQVGGNPRLTYEGWFNYHQSGKVKECFDCLAVQERILIFFFTGTIKPTMIISVNNNLQIGFRMYIQQLRNTIPWSIEDFEHARWRQTRKYPSTIALWHGLKEDGERK